MTNVEQIPNTSQEKKESINQTNPENSKIINNQEEENQKSNNKIDTEKEKENINNNEIEERKDFANTTPANKHNKIKFLNNDDEEGQTNINFNKDNNISKKEESTIRTDGRRLKRKIVLRKSVPKREIKEEEEEEQNIIKKNIQTQNDFDGMSEEGSYVMIKENGKILTEDQEQLKLIEESQANYILKMKKEGKDIKDINEIKEEPNKTEENNDKKENENEKEKNDNEEVKKEDNDAKTCHLSQFAPCFSKLSLTHR